MKNEQMFEFVCWTINTFLKA